jgi:putative transposase
VFPVVFIDALMVRIRDGVVTNRAVYLAIGIDCDGNKQILGLWVGPTTGESAKFWLTVLSELKSRLVADVCIVCCAGLSGLPDAISVVRLQATVRLCVEHLIRASLRYASRKYWAPLTKDLRPVCRRRVHSQHRLRRAHRQLRQPGRPRQPAPIPPQHRRHLPGPLPRRCHQ